MVRNGTGILFKLENDALHKQCFVAATMEKYYKRVRDEAVRPVGQSLSAAPEV
jgi:hypothetical protein